jgi:predicted amidohydrolase YtcJ
MKNLVLALLLFCGLAAAEDADLVFRNGVIWTVDADNPSAEAVATSGDRILFVGSNQHIRKYITNKPKVIDLEGQFLVPGFNDNHVHFEKTGRLLYGLNLLDVPEEQEFADRIRAVDARYPPGSWITGGDWSAYGTWAVGEGRTPSSIRTTPTAICSCPTRR